MESKGPAGPARREAVQIPELKKKITLRELLAVRCERYREKVFLVDPETNKQYSYRVFQEKVNAVSNLLYKLGVRKEDKVSLFMPNAAEYLFAFFGIMQLGAVACPLNTGLKSEEIGYILDNSDSVALFTTAEFLASAGSFLGAQKKIRHILIRGSAKISPGKNAAVQGSDAGVNSGGSSPQQDIPEGIAPAGSGETPTNELISQEGARQGSGSGAFIPQQDARQGSGSGAFIPQQDARRGSGSGALIPQQDARQGEVPGPPRLQQGESWEVIDWEISLPQQDTQLLPEVLAIVLQADDVAEIVYTSGTTGRPKGAMLTHHNMIVDAHWVAAWNRLQEKDRALCVMPLFHVNGQIVTVMAPLLHGGSVVMPHRFSVSKFFRLVAAYGVNYVGTVATMLSMLLNRVDPREIPAHSLRIVFCGSAPVPVKVQSEFEKTFRVPVIEGYGMTETTCRATFNPLPPPEALKLGEDDGYRKFGSVGLPLGNEMKVVDANGNPLGPRAVGEIVLRGENIMKGYYKNPAATAAAFSGGWFYSDDLGYYDEDGYFYLVDRKKDLIIRGGENIYPREIEEVLYKHPAVRDAACIGIPDELYGEEVVAVVVFKDRQKATAEELLAFCRQSLADFKSPKKIRFVQEIPKSSSGKLLRRELRARWEGFN